MSVPPPATLALPAPPAAMVLGVARPASFHWAWPRAAPACSGDVAVRSVMPERSSVPNGVIVHHLIPRLAAAARTSVIGRNAAPPRSIGTSAPAAALTHKASRNSSLLPTSSPPRVLIPSRPRSDYHTPEL